MIIYLLAVMEVIAVQWIYGYSNFTRDIEFMLGRKTGRYWAFCWVFFIPVLLTAILVYKFALNETVSSGDYVFGQGAIGKCLLVLLPVGPTVHNNLEHRHFYW